MEKRLRQNRKRTRNLEFILSGWRKFLSLKQGESDFEESEPFQKVAHQKVGRSADGVDQNSKVVASVIFITFEVINTTALPLFSKDLKFGAGTLVKVKPEKCWRPLLSSGRACLDFWDCLHFRNALS